MSAVGIAAVVADNAVVVVVGRNWSEGELGPVGKGHVAAENKTVKKKSMVVTKSMVGSRSMAAPKKCLRTMGNWIGTGPEDGFPPEVCERSADFQQHTEPVEAWDIWEGRP